MADPAGSAQGTSVVDYKAIEELGKDFVTKGTQMKERVESLKKMTARLQDAWVGGAADVYISSYEDKMGPLSYSIADPETGYEKIGRKLVVTAQTYREADKTAGQVANEIVIPSWNENV